MNIVKEYENPCRSRYILRYNSLPESIQHQWDSIDKLPKEKLNLRPIKRKMKPDIREGTIFAMKLPENMFIFGKVVATDLNLPMIENDFFVVFIFRYSSKSLEGYPIELSYDNILLGPWIISNGLWRNGTCYTVGFCGLTEEEKNIDYGFYEFKIGMSNEGKIIDDGFICDVKGYRLNHEPIFLEHCACITIYGIETKIRREIIVTPQLLITGN